MVALLTRLQLKLTLRGFRGDTAKIVGMVFLALYGLFMMGSFLIGSYFLRLAGVEWIGPVSVLVFAAVSLLWPLLMMVLGTNDALTPGRFALLPVRARDLQPGLLAALALTFGGIITIVATVGYLIAWSQQGTLFIVAALAAVLALAWTFLCTRTLTTAIGRAMNTRRFRDTGIIIFGLLVMVFAVGAQFLQYLIPETEGMSAQTLGLYAEVASWTPFGWAWSLPWEVAQARWWALALKLVLTLATAVLLWWGWAKALEQALTSPLDAGGSAKKIEGHGRLDRLMPAGPVGSIAARTLRYWSRDPRRKMQAIAMLVVPVAFAVPFMTNPEGLEGLLLVPIVTGALIAMALVASELPYDGSAVWAQVVAGVKGKDDRWGRILAVTLMVGPVLVIVTIAVLAITGAWWATITLFAASLGTLGVGFGIGAWAGTIWVYPVPPAGGNMFNTRGNMGASFGIMLAMLLEFFILVPLVGLAVASYWWPVLAIISPIVSLGLGALVLWGGVTLGGRYLDNNWPEVLTKITWTKGQ